MEGRRHDIDWLRVITIGLLLIYHSAIGFQPWGVLIGFIQNTEPLKEIWIPMSLLNVWRIPILFFISGMGVYFAISKRSWRQLITERARRILLPFLFGMIAIVPLHVLIWQWFYNQELTYLPVPAHLWFLGNIFIYVFVLSPLFFYLKRKEESRAGHVIRRVFRSPLGILLIVALFIGESVIIRPQTYELYALTLHGFVLGLISFLAGFICVYAGDGFWRITSRYWWLFIGMAFSLFLLRMMVYNFNSPNYLKGIESCLWIFSVFGIGYRYLNRGSRMLSYLSQAAYPVYIVHMVFLYAGSALIFPMGLPAMVKFVFVSCVTFAGSMLVYEYLIRRAGILRPLFGLLPDKNRQRKTGRQKLAPVGEAK